MTTITVVFIKNRTSNQRVKFKFILVTLKESRISEPATLLSLPDQCLLKAPRPGRSVEQSVAKVRKFAAAIGCFVGILAEGINLKDGHCATQARPESGIGWLWPSPFFGECGKIHRQHGR